MKGLLLHDWYQAKKYCRTMGFLTVFFLVLYGIDGQSFCLIYPCMLMSMIPITMLSYDEKTGWQRYCKNFPLKRGQYVSEKYLMGLLASLAAELPGMILLAVQWGRGQVTLAEVGALGVSMAAMSLVSPGLTLPFVFRFGAERGRMAYYVVVGGSCAAVMLFMGEGLQLTLPGTLLCAAAVVLYVLSWLLSIRLFEKRE